jgi:hypothetical protein
VHRIAAGQQIALWRAGDGKRTSTGGTRPTLCTTLTRLRILVADGLFTAMCHARRVRLQAPRWIRRQVPSHLNNLPHIQNCSISAGDLSTELGNTKVACLVVCVFRVGLPPPSHSGKTRIALYLQ